MRWGEWLAEAGLNYSQAARLINTIRKRRRRDPIRPERCRRWALPFTDALFQRPEPDNLAEIFELTNGRVTPNDFHNIVDLEAHRAAQRAQRASRKASNHRRKAAARKYARAR